MAQAIFSEDCHKHCTKSCLSSPCIILPKLTCPVFLAQQLWAFVCLRNPRFEHPCFLMGRSGFEIFALSKCVVGFLPMTLLSIFPRRLYLHFIVWSGIRNLYIEELIEFQACACGEYIGME